MEALVAVAGEDQDEWVRVTHEIIKDYPARQLLNMNTLASTSSAAAQATKQITETRMLAVTMPLFFKKKCRGGKGQKLEVKEGQQ